VFFISSVLVDMVIRIVLLHLAGFGQALGKPVQSRRCFVRAETVNMPVRPQPEFSAD
jgi:hypothetical protein